MVIMKYGACMRRNCATNPSTLNASTSAFHSAAVWPFCPSQCTITPHPASANPCVLSFFAIVRTPSKSGTLTQPRRLAKQGMRRRIPE